MKVEMFEAFSGALPDSLYTFHALILKMTFLLPNFMLMHIQHILLHFPLKTTHFYFKKFPPLLITTLQLLAFTLEVAVDCSFKGC